MFQGENSKVKQFKNVQWKSLILNGVCVSVRIFCNIFHISILKVLIYD